MNYYLLFAASLTFLLGITHSILGEKKILRKLKQENLPQMEGIPLLWKNADATRLTIRMVWHGTSILMFCIATILLYFSALPHFLAEIHFTIIWVITVVMFLCCLVSFILSRGSHMAWLLFLLIGILCLVGVQ